MNQSDKITIAGHRGLAGSAIVSSLHKHGHINLLTRTLTELDLIDRHATADFIAGEKPGRIILAPSLCES